MQVVGIIKTIPIVQPTTALGDHRECASREIVGCLIQMKHALERTQLIICHVCGAIIIVLIIVQDALPIAGMKPIVKPQDIAGGI